MHTEDTIANEIIQKALKTIDKRSEVSRDSLQELLELTAEPEGGNHALLFGPRGTGKTTTACLSALPGQDVLSVTLTGEGSAASLWGHYIPKGGEFIWQDGPALQAWRGKKDPVTGEMRGSLLVMNEIDHASEDVSNLLHVLLDNPAVAKVTLPTGETVTPAPGFRCIASMNGVMEELALAVLDRFAIRVAVVRPSMAMYDKLPGAVKLATFRFYEDSYRKGGKEPVITYREMGYFGKFVKLYQKTPSVVANFVCGGNKKGNILLEAVQMAKVELGRIAKQREGYDLGPELPTQLENLTSPKSGTSASAAGPKTRRPRTPAAYDIDDDDDDEVNPNVTVDLNNLPSFGGGSISSGYGKNPDAGFKRGGSYKANRDKVKASDTDVLDTLTDFFKSDMEIDAEHEGEII